MSPVEPAVQNPEAPSPPTGEGSPPLSEGTPEQAAPLPEPVEKVRKIYVRDLQEKERIQTVFRVSKKSRHVSRNGKVFLAVSLADKTGEIDSRIFDQAEEYENKFAVDDFVLVTGEVISFHGRPQVLIKGLDRLEPEPIDPAEFAAQKDEASKPVSQLREIFERVQDPNVRSLLLAFLEDPQVAEGLGHAPAAKGAHHAYRGGLADHLLSVIKLALRVADHYSIADRDLLVAGAFLHDIGRVSDDSDEGRLVGYPVIAVQKIHEKAAQIPNFPPLLEHHLTHLVLAHEGSLELGSPKLPQTLEALIVDLINLLDSRVASWLEIMARDSNEKWTDPSRLYSRQLWKGPLPTVRGKSPVDSKPKRRDNERKKSRPPPPPAPTVVFKPLNELTASPPLPAGEPQGERHEDEVGDKNGGQS